MQEDRSESSKSWLERLAQAFSDDGPQDRKELLEVLRNACREQILDHDALQIIEGAMRVGDLQVREIMIPRSQISFVEIDEHWRSFLPRIIETAHSRYPVIGESVNDIKGILLAKDLLKCLLEDGGLDGLDMNSILRPVTVIPESKRLNVLLKEFQDSHHHMAIIVDEYGGTAGLVTIEDVLEQIVGDIEDEHDADDPEEVHIKSMGNSQFLVRALTPIEDFNDFFKTALEDDEYDTIGGIITQLFGRLPRRDEAVEMAGFTFKVLSADNRRIRLLQVTPIR
ncbi:magnesium transporter [Pokkaliibacter plantistimulans]|uniref:Magnesium and cobalt efflux protein CorC n=1 Tax=Pokkaliibacter plantistimulans TaxID=1635171 RepID=A0ABX5LQC2_9GAMM|nr:transporter associated domain-containing protein [Pokkaliibacter plantistimulans]PXF28864.1 magnesium transporter [Pokkaliibacter plantistimulans]